jgi:amino acid transporter
MDPGVTAALATGSSEYVVVLWPAAGGAERWLAIGVIWALAAVSMVGLTLSARVLATMTIVKVVALAAVVVVALVRAAGAGRITSRLSVGTTRLFPLAKRSRSGL